MENIRSGDEQERQGDRLLPLAGRPGCRSQWLAAFYPDAGVLTEDELTGRRVVENTLCQSEKAAGS